MSEQHKKHAALARPKAGRMHRIEIGIVGAPCEQIEFLAKALMEELDPTARIAYVDASHRPPVPSRFAYSLTDHQQHIEFVSPVADHPYDIMSALMSANAAIINGNHFAARTQLVIIHGGKRESLRRRLDQLTDVQAIVLDSDQEEVFDFIKKLNGIDNVPIFKLDQLYAIKHWFKHWLENHRPPVNGLILAGGQSRRMGQDKSTLTYHGVDQMEYLSSLFDTLGMDYFISKRKRIDNDPLHVLEDQFADLGPYGALLTAFQKEPDTAWLAIACDLPLVQSHHLEDLIKRRNWLQSATAYLNHDTDFPEPMMCIWEPVMYSRLLYFLSLGYSCPRKVLINSRIELLDQKEVSDSFLFNANTPEDQLIALNRIKRRQ